MTTLDIICIVSLVVWAAASFIVHNAIHELSHAGVVTWYGGKVTELWLFPTFLSGRFVFAFTSFNAKLSDKQLKHVLISPLVSESIWFLVFASLLVTSFALDWSIYLKIFFGIETLYPLIS